MKNKIQNFGLNKDVLTKQFRFVAEEALENTNKSPEDFDDVISAFVEVSLYGWDNISENRFLPSTVQIMKQNFRTLENINELTANLTRSQDKQGIINKVTSRFDLFAEYLKRAEVPDVQVSEAEIKYLKNINDLEIYLQSYWADKILKRFEEIEKEIIADLNKLYSSELSEIEIRKEIFDYLDSKEKELTNEFVETFGVEMDKAVTVAALALLEDFGIKKPEPKFIETLTQGFAFGYFSNVSGNFANELRRLKESANDNLLLGSNKRSVATDYLNNFSINKNVMKLSTITHPRGLFRAITAKQFIKEGIGNFKAVVPEFVVETLNPSGITVKYLYQIKTQNEWSKAAEATTPNVIDGLSLHHNDQIYYLPIKKEALAKETAIAKLQRQKLIKGLTKD